MTAVPGAPTVPVLARSEVVGRPRFEGSNICTWIGFKHVMYLVEEAVLDHLRQSGLTPRRLYEEHGIGVEIVDSDARIITALHMDDEVRTEVRTLPCDGPGLRFKVETFVDRPSPSGAPRTKAVSATVRVLLRAGSDDGAEPAEVPPELAPYAVAAIGQADRDRSGEPAGHGDVDELVRGTNAVVWRRRIPYFYCHFSRRLQHSGYLRLMEEVVDIFLADRGISIRTMLDSRSWIPVVPQARVEIVDEALMEEEIITVFTVEEVYKRLTYTARMDCYVERDGRLLRTATGRITHGYATILDRRDWALASFDDVTLAALNAEEAR